jgi:hypothetical protein
MKTIHREAQAEEKEREDQRTMSMEETSSANSVTRRILAIPPCTLTSSRSTQKALTEKLGIPLQVEEAEVAPEKMYLSSYLTFAIALSKN